MQQLNPELIKKLHDSIRNANIVFGVDGEDRILVYGRDVLERIVATGKTEHLCICNVPIDAKTEDLEILIAAVRVTHGHDDYKIGAVS